MQRGILAFVGGLDLGVGLATNYIPCLIMAFIVALVLYFDWRLNLG